MRVLISADMEGVTGVTCPDDVRPGSARWEYFRALLTGDVNAAVEGFFEAGADEVIVNEAHANKRNLLITELDRRAVAIIGTHKIFGMMEGIDSGIDAVAFVGYHAGAGEQGVLSHTYVGTTVLGVRTTTGRPLIGTAATAALRQSGGRPDPPDAPFRYDVEFDAAQAAGACTAIPGVEQTGPRSVTFTLPTMAAAIRCFKVVTTLALASAEEGYG